MNFLLNQSLISTLSYILKLADTKLLDFDMVSEGRDVLVRIARVYDGSDELLPLDWSFRLTGDREQLAGDMAAWLKQRSIPSNRAYAHSFLARLGLAEHDVAGIMELCHGLSLNDSYWIDDARHQRGFAEVNLYDNSFSREIAYMAFTGTGSYNIPGFSLSPEFTTNGAYAKCWRRVDGGIYLYKEGSVGAANSGGEPYAEYYASNLASVVGIDAVPYAPTRWKGHFCSKCKLFTNKEISFVSIGRLVRTGGIEAVAAWYGSRGEVFREAFADMLLFDALILNTDRHFGNFGVLVDSGTNKIIGPAPLFDHGCSLLFSAMQDDFDNIGAYAAGQLPRAYADFIGMARRFMGPSQKKKLRRALEFRFKKHARYNWPDWRLRGLEGLIHDRARKMLTDEV